MPKDSYELRESTHARLLRAMDRRDPWDASDLVDWLTGNYPDEFDNANVKCLAAEFADGLATELIDDPAFVLIVKNLNSISIELRKGAH